MRQGALAYVMGPSGVGKDTLLNAARARLDGQDFAFAHRYITRAPVPGDEVFVSLTRQEFAARKAAGLFAFDWQARDVGYAIGAEIGQWRQAGLTIVVSGSRADWATGKPASAGAVPVVIEASPAILAARLAARAREDAAEIEARLARAAALETAIPGAVRIDNSGALEAGVAAFAAALKQIQAASAA